MYGTLLPSAHFVDNILASQPALRHLCSIKTALGPALIANMLCVTKPSSPQRDHVTAIYPPHASTSLYQQQHSIVEDMMFAPHTIAVECSTILPTYIPLAAAPKETPDTPMQYSVPEHNWQN